MFLSKEDLKLNASAFNLEIDGLPFSQQQSVVLKFLKENGLEALHTVPVAGQETPAVFPKGADLSVPEAVAQEPVLVRGHSKRVELPAPMHHMVQGVPELANKTILWSPEIQPHGRMIYRYEEFLGEDLEVEELKYTGKTLDARGIVPGPGSPYGEGISGTYTVKTRPGSKLTAISSLPIFNVKISQHYNAQGLPDVNNSFPVCELDGRIGYLYKHPCLECVLPQLMASHRYNDFKDDLKDEPNILYVGGLLCINIDYCEWMMREIEEREAIRNGRFVR